MEYNFNANQVRKDLVKWIRDWFKENGGKCAVVGISGGVDSSVVAALCVEALGKDHVLGVTMPNGGSNDPSANELINLLQIMSVDVDISGAVESIHNEVKLVPTEQSTINLPPRIRMATLYYVSQCINGRVANTCNLSEDWVGYNTRYGDSVGDFSPLSRLTKTEVIAIAEDLGLPGTLSHKTPTDGLCGKTDEERFGFSYKVLDNYIRTGVCEDEEVKAKIDNMNSKNLFKLQPMPCFEYKPNN